MASSQVEIASSLPFDRVLKDHNPHDACITHAAFKENIKTFVSHDSAPNQNTQKPINSADTWVSRVAKNNLGTLCFMRRDHNTCKEKDDSSLPALVSPRHSSIVDRWAARQAQETVSTALENYQAKVLKDFPSRSSSFAYRKEVPPISCVVDGSSETEISNLGASSLVQIWEKRLNHFNENAFGQVISSPRIIRGRRAFNDLLMQFENDRYRELNNLAQRGAVSKFTQRGSIQSLLRLRLLQRGVAVFDQSCHKSETAKVNSQPQGSAIMQLRERFSTGVEHRSPALIEVSDPRKLDKDTANNITQLDNSPIINQLSKDGHCKAVYGTGIHCTQPAQNSMLQTSTNNKEAHPSLYVTIQGKCFEAQNDDPKETTRECSSMVDPNANEMANEAEARDQQCDESSYEYDEIAEEEEAGDENYDELSYDWISPISRPRSYWEARRQEWYKEMLDFGSDNDEIHNLLQRRTVSTFLSSDFRETMDRLIKSRIGAQTSQDGDEDSQESRDQLMAFFHEHLNSPEDGMDKERAEEEDERIHEVEEEKEEKVEEQEEESIINDSDHESSDCSIQSSPSMHASSPLRTWSYKDNEVGDDYDRVAYISSQPPPQSQSSYQDSRQYSSSSTSHHSIEMEFLYELRGQMNQLFHEMSELRKSIKSCMDMQTQLQQFKNQEVYSVKEEGKKLHDKTPKKGNCCICYEKKVAAVLYRCGHMCACLKCANELQWKGENCPICKAPILDVVRVHDDK